MLGGRRQLRERGIHGAVSGLENIDAVDLFRMDDPDPIVNARFRVNGLEDLFPDLFGELFGIVQPQQSVRQTINLPLPRQHRRRRNHRPGQWSAARFVHARQTSNAGSKLSALILKPVVHAGFVADYRSSRNLKLLKKGHREFPVPFGKGFCYLRSFTVMARLPMRPRR